METAEKNISFFSGRNEFYANANRLYCNTYRGRQINEIYDTDSLPDYFSYSLSSVLIIITLLMGIIPVFCSEYECDMNTVLLTSKCGRLKTVNAKIIASIIFTFTVTLLFSLCDFIGFMLFNGLDGLSQSVYAIQGYENCPLNINVWQFLFLQFVFKYIGMCILSLAFLIFSRLFKKSNLPFICGLIMLFTLMLCKVFITSQTGKYVNLINPISFLTSYNNFSDFNILNIFGVPVFEWQIMIMIGLMLIAILYAIILLIPLKMGFKRRHIK